MDELSATQKASSAAALRALEPFADFMLEARIGVGEFLALAKRAYVEAAIRQNSASAPSGKRGNRSTPGISLSSIAVETGLTRQEVARLLKRQQPVRFSSRLGPQRAERVLAGWWNNPEFHDENGRPARLSLRGSKRSLAALVSRYSGQARIAPIVTALLRAQAIRRHGDGRYEVLSRTCANVRWSREGLEALGDEVAQHFKVLLHNLRRPQSPQYARRVHSVWLEPRHAAALLRDIEEHAAIFLEATDEALHRPRLTRRPQGRDAVRVSVGVQIVSEPREPGKTRMHLTSIGKGRRAG